jgi:hypothetical protein
VAPPVPAQWAAYPRNTSVPRVNTKLAVHWEPSVTITVPGWMVAVDAAANWGAVAAVGANPSQPRTEPTATAATAVIRPALRALIASSSDRLA